MLVIIVFAYFFILRFEHIFLIYLIKIKLNDRSSQDNSLKEFREQKIILKNKTNLLLVWIPM